VPLIYDISSLARWSGPAVGIARTDRELALWVRTNRPDAVFAFFDPERQVFRRVDLSWVDLILAGDALIDLLGMPSPHRHRTRGIERIPKRLRPAVLWLLQFRRKLLGALERLRIKQRRQKTRERIELIQGLLMSSKHRAEFYTREGRRRSRLPLDMVGPELTFGPADTLFSAGMGWAHLNVDAIRRLKDSTQLRFVVLCYDIIPLLFPQFYVARDVDQFREHFRVAFPIADRVIFTARRIECDARDYCHSNGLVIAATAIASLGTDAPRVPSASALPSELKPGRYALFVSTIEPRKGHGMLFRVWRRLLTDGVPQALNFKLVFVGRIGWMVDDMLDRINADQTVAESLLIISNAEDSVLSTVYEGAAFCLYPSVYEGFGLPVVEALSRGKAIIASTGGALPEVVGEFSPCLDPADEDAWYAKLKQWIADPTARVPYENAIRARFHCMSWREAAEQVLRTAEAESTDKSHLAPEVAR
jgi:glycosyltransferase involved in cell wall biosynthesis